MFNCCELPVFYLPHCGHVFILIKLSEHNDYKLLEEKQMHKNMAERFVNDNWLFFLSLSEQNNIVEVNLKSQNEESTRNECVLSSDDV